MRALEPEVVEVLWKTFEPLLPAPPDSHPLGCHRRRVPDRLCFWGILIRLTTGSSWVDIEAILRGSLWLSRTARCRPVGAD